MHGVVVQLRALTPSLQRAWCNAFNTWVFQQLLTRCIDVTKIRQPGNGSLALKTKFVKHEKMDNLMSRTIVIYTKKHSKNVVVHSDFQLLESWRTLHDHPMNIFNDEVNLVTCKQSAGESTAFPWDMWKQSSQGILVHTSISLVFESSTFLPKIHLSVTVSVSISVYNLSVSLISHISSHGIQVTASSDFGKPQLAGRVRRVTMDRLSGGQV